MIVISTLQQILMMAESFYVSHDMFQTAKNTLYSKYSLIGTIFSRNVVLLLFSFSTHNMTTSQF